MENQQSLAQRVALLENEVAALKRNMQPQQNPAPPTYNYNQYSQPYQTAAPTYPAPSYSTYNYQQPYQTPAPNFQPAPQYGTQPYQTYAQAYPPQQPVPNSPMITKPFNSEFWLNKIGIFLLLIGVASLLAYSVEKGWLVPGLRVGVAFLIGVILLVIGLRVRQGRPNFSQVLLGGSIAAFYFTGYAAYQLYNLVWFPVAFAFMIGVTLLAFFLSLNQDEVFLALIGTIGGLSTPFVLSSGQGSVAVLVGYTGLLIAGTAAIYYAKRWLSLLWTAFVGSWWVLALTVFAMKDDRWVVQIGLIFAGMVFVGLPTLAEFLAAPKSVKNNLVTNSTELAKLLNFSTFSLIFLSPVMVLWLTAGNWQMHLADWGWLALGLAFVYGIIAFFLLTPKQKLAYAYALSGLTLLNLSFAAFLHGENLLLTLAVEATLLHFVAKKSSVKFLSLLGHFLTVCVGLWLASVFSAYSYYYKPELLSLPTFIYLLVIGLTAVSALFLATKQEAGIYLLAAHVGFMAWLWWGFSTLQSGQVYVTTLWGIYALILVALGIGFKQKLLANTGLITLMVVVGKLLLVDLIVVDVFWRIWLFLGFGTLVLILSYAFKDLWRKLA